MMKSSRAVALMASMSMSVSSCFHYSHEKDWATFKSSPEFSSEKQSFEKNMGGKVVCAKSLADFLFEGGEAHQKCIYVAHNLKVIQVQKSGYLVSLPRAENTLFIYKTDEEGAVDGTILNESHANYYEYSGPLTYETVLGAAKTVHSFKKITPEVVKAHRELKNYSPIEEFYSERQAWHNSAKYAKREKGDHYDFDFWGTVGLIASVALTVISVVGITKDSSQESN